MTEKNPGPAPEDEAISGSGIWVLKYPASSVRIFCSARGGLSPVEPVADRSLFQDDLSPSHPAFQNDRETESLYSTTRSNRSSGTRRICRHGHESLYLHPVRPFHGQIHRYLLVRSFKEDHGIVPPERPVDAEVPDLSFRVGLDIPQVPGNNPSLNGVLNFASPMKSISHLVPFCRACEGGAI